MLRIYLAVDHWLHRRPSMQRHRERQLEDAIAHGVRMARRGLRKTA